MYLNKAYIFFKICRIQCTLHINCLSKFISYLRTLPYLTLQISFSTYNKKNPDIMIVTACENKYLDSSNMSGY